MVILDTSIIIDHLRTPKGKTSWLVTALSKHRREKFALSMVSIQELYAGRSTRMERQEKDMLAVIGSLKIMPYSYEIAQKAGELERDSRLTIEFADLAIAATAIIHGAELATLNQKHFSGIKELNLFRLSSKSNQGRNRR